MLARTNSTKSSKSFKGKGKATAVQPSKPKVSNRPRNSPSPSASESDGDESEEDEAAERARMMAALEQHQQSFLQGALPSTSKLLHTKQAEKVAPKPVWEMDMDDFDDEDDSEDESEGEQASTSQRRPPPQAVVFEDPGRASALSSATVVSFEEPRGDGVGSHRDMRDFMSSKVKNARKTIGVADLANAKRTGKPRKQAEEGLGAEEESHLASLDSHLSTLLRPLIAPASHSGGATSQLPSLLSTLPIAPTKALKGLTPLPGNAPRSLRAGQSAKNLERAQKRDEANGLVAGSKRGRVGEGQREALSLKEKRREEAGEGGVKRQRGLKGAVGRLGGGELRLSREDIERVSGGGGASRGGKKGGRGGGGGRGKGRK